MKEKLFIRCDRDLPAFQTDRTAQSRSVLVTFQMILFIVVFSLQCNEMCDIFGEEIVNALRCGVLHNTAREGRIG